LPDEIREPTRPQLQVEFAIRPVQSPPDRRLGW